jgi:hypothetical protein
MSARPERPTIFAELCPWDSTWRHQAFAPVRMLRLALNRPSRTGISTGAPRGRLILSQRCPGKDRFGMRGCCN